ncbi:hypothetical protein Scep_010261 [Stephania cephalantha]|uniref:Uncharacterized protein n=1 Tax=Stephania cephalantha TaxID=152367 RepID=A0AAP0JWY1_9MAGN
MMGVSVLCTVRRHNYQDLEMEYEASKIAFDSDTTTWYLKPRWYRLAWRPVLEDPSNTANLYESYEKPPISKEDHGWIEIGSFEVDLVCGDAFPSQTPLVLVWLLVMLITWFEIRV